MPSEVSSQGLCRTLLLIKDGSLEVVPGIYQVLGLRHFGERQLGDEGPDNLRGMLRTCPITTYPKGVPPEEV